MNTAPDDITCKELVELVTDYLESALPRADRARLETHLEICDECRDYVDQMRATISASGRIGEDPLEGPMREALLESFRGWKRGAGL